MTYNLFKNKDLEAESATWTMIAVLKRLIGELFESDGLRKCSEDTCNEWRNPAKLMLCGRCRQVLYCSRDCQVRAHKNGHKEHCKQLVAANQSTDTVIDNTKTSMTIIDNQENAENDI